MNSVQQRQGRGALSFSTGQANYLLGMVTFAYAMSYVDRQMLNLLVEPIKHTLGISDTEFSFIQGTAFVVAYLAAVPVFGRLVDVASRRGILIFGVFSWCLFTMLSGLCHTYTELFMARMGVGITEACVFPAAWSMIGDAFPPKRLPRAMAIFFLGPPLGGGFSLIAGGVIIAFAAGLAGVIPVFRGLQPWQLAFIVTALPGMLFAVLLFTMREPPRRRKEADAAEQAPAVSEVAAFLMRKWPIYALILFGNGMLAMVQLAIPGWFPAFMIRAHGLTAVETGLTLGLISTVTALTGSLSGAAASEWLARRGHADAPLRAATIATVPLLACTLLLPLVSSSAAAFATAGGNIFFTAFIAGLLSAVTQMVTPGQMRGVVASLYSFFAQIIGYMLGPIFIALLTDRYFANPAMVGYSLQIVTSVGTVLLAACMFALLNPFRTLVADGGTDH